MSQAQAPAQSIAGPDEPLHVAVHAPPALQSISEPPQLSESPLHVIVQVPLPHRITTSPQASYARHDTEHAKSVGHSIVVVSHESRPSHVISQ